MSERIVSNVAPVIKGLLDLLGEMDQSLKFVYDEEQTYDSSIKRLRANGRISGDVREVFPLLSYSRSVLRTSTHGVSRRLNTMPIIFPQGGGIAVKTAALHGEFDLPFRLYTKSAVALENFEISYLSEVGASNEKEFTVTLPELGDFKYFVAFAPLEVKEHVSEGTFYKAAQGQMTVRGMFFLFKGESPVITKVSASIREMLGQELADILLT